MKFYHREAEIAILQENERHFLSISTRNKIFLTVSRLDVTIQR